MIQAALPPYSIVYEVEEPVEVGEFHDDTADIKQLVQAIEELNKNLSALHEDMNPTEEETSEEMIEDVTEEPTEQEPSDLEKKVDSIDKTISEMNEREKTKEAEEQRAQEAENDSSSASIVYLDETVDTHMYLTTPVENASLNDIFTVGLSVRNLLLVFFLFWLLLKLFGLLRAAVERVMNR